MGIPWKIPASRRCQSRPPRKLKNQKPGKTWKNLGEPWKMMGKWWVNDGEMMGNWWENDGELIKNDGKMMVKWREHDEHVWKNMDKWWINAGLTWFGHQKVCKLTIENHGFYLEWWFDHLKLGRLGEQRIHNHRNETSKLMQRNMRMWNGLLRRLTDLCTNNW